MNKIFTLAWQYLTVSAEDCVFCTWNHIYSAHLFLCMQYITLPKDKQTHICMCQLVMYLLWDMTLDLSVLALYRCLVSANYVFQFPSPASFWIHAEGGSGRKWEARTKGESMMFPPSSLLFVAWSAVTCFLPVPAPHGQCPSQSNSKWPH